MNTFDKWLKAATETTTTAAVADNPQPLKKKKKNENKYDGRTREGRKFVERMLARREAKKNAQEVKEYTILDEANSSVIAQVKAIVANKQAAKIGGKMIDMQTASFISQIYDKAKTPIKKKMENDKIENLVNLAQKVMSRES